MATQPFREDVIREMAARPAQKTAPQGTRPVMSREKPAGRAAKLRARALLKQRALLAAIRKSLGRL
jgi:hypothetical protein